MGCVRVNGLCIANAPTNSIGIANADERMLLFNEMNRAQLDAISQAMAELQANPPLRQKMKKIEFYIPEDNNKE